MSIDARGVLQEDYGLRPETTEQVVRWLSARSGREKTIFLCRAAGMSLRATANVLGVSHTTVSATIHTWGDLKDVLDG